MAEETSVADLLDEPLEGDEEEDEPGPAEDFAMKAGIPTALVAVYLLFLSPVRMFDLAPGAGDLLIINESGWTPFAGIAVVALTVAFATGLFYAGTGRERYEDYQSEIATGTIIPPAVVILLGFAVILLEPVANKILLGNVVDAMGFLVVELIIVGILLVSSIGLIAAMVFFGVYLWIPSYVGSFVGTFIGELLDPESG
ncbi:MULTISPECIES: hypothetical protein [Haloarcula]|uniref:hypothetical protein n=1 Tax=Haloarcula TaxID=2237 RepID=UPI0023E7CE7F|nr:hypothetical protein [Halomicroarcula sp. SHR3]